MMNRQCFFQGIAYFLTNPVMLIDVLGPRFQGLSCVDPFGFGMKRLDDQAPQVGSLHWRLPELSFFPLESPALFIDPLSLPHNFQTIVIYS